MLCMPQRISNKIREQIEQNIVSGIWLPGKRLDESVLADQFNVSRTPVREALHQVSLSGLVELRLRRGAFVCQIGIHEMVEMFEVMAELEGMCARLAARRITQEGIKTLNKLLRQCETVADLNDSNAYYQANEKFHMAIYESSGNAFLIAQSKALHNRLKPYRRLQLLALGRIRQSLAEHRQITEAIITGKVDLATALIKEHILIQGERFSDLVASITKT